MRIDQEKSIKVLNLTTIEAIEEERKWESNDTKDSLAQLDDYDYMIIEKKAPCPQLCGFSLETPQFPPQLKVMLELETLNWPPF